MSSGFIGIFTIAVDTALEVRSGSPKVKLFSQTVKKGMKKQSELGAEYDYF